MRLWHKDLIPVLPRQQLIGQWRECCAIAKAIAENGTPNHILVNRIMDYSIQDFFHYALLIDNEMHKRGYKCSFYKFSMFISEIFPISKIKTTFNKEEVFSNWHNDRYLQQCLHNLQEKYDCGAIPDEEWNFIIKKYPSVA